MGITTLTSAPRALSAFGREPATSPNPPLLTNGAASEDTINIFKFSACFMSAASFLFDNYIIHSKPIYGNIFIFKPSLFKNRVLIFSTNTNKMPPPYFKYFLPADNAS